MMNALAWDVMAFLAEALRPMWALIVHIACMYRGLELPSKSYPKLHFSLLINYVNGFFGELGNCKGREAFTGHAVSGSWLVAEPFVPANR
eukprot:12367974-Ditylum_brightwellii.AAC.1